MEFKDYYRILGIEPGATGKEIKNAYRKMASSSHPDKSTGKDPDSVPDSGQFIEVKEAYDVLSNHERRKEYDMIYRAEKTGKDYNFPGSGVYGEGSFESGTFDQLINDLFSRFFGEEDGSISQGKSFGNRPDHIHYDDLLRKKR